MKSVKKIAVMTSGGDAPGMNAALRGVVRAALNRGWEVFGIRSAYRGLAEGGANILPLDWLDVSWNFREGGTFLGSARFPGIAGDAFTAQELKQQALLNLKGLNITGLVVIGGDGSLTGAHELFTFLQNSRWASPELRDIELSVVAIPGSIDNDIPFTDMSIGVDTTLNTIIECIDKLRDTATSHGRVSIVEVMGRLRGYLAVMSGLATGADRIFVGEERISQSELNTMLQVLQESFVHGQKAGIIIRSEGAGFSTGFLKETIAMLLEPRREVRETVLGHLQRGGNPTAFERILATRMGIKAVQLLDEGLSEPQMIGLTHNKLESVPLSMVLEKLAAPEFKNQLSPNTRNALHLCQKLEEPPQGNPSTGIRVAVLTDGGNVSGMNIAVRAIARLAISQGLEAVGIKGGFSGLLQGAESVLHLDWSMLELKGIVRRAGTLLGFSSNGFPDAGEHAALRQQVNKLSIKGLIVIGGSTAYQYADSLAGTLQIPAVGIPAALCCSLLGTDLVIGIDSALNDFLNGIDRAVDAANVQRKIYIIQITGDYCDCLVKLAALAGGSEAVIIDPGGDRQAFQTLMQEKIQGLKRIIAGGKNFASVIFFARQPDLADKDLQEIRRCILESGIPLEIALLSLESTLGGIVPTAFDRILAQRLAERALAVLQQKMEQHENSFHLVGIKGRQIIETSYQDIKQGAINRACQESLVSELDQCIEYMSLPGARCAGLGGTITWIDTSDAEKWQGRWTCRQCGQQQDILFNPQNLHVIYCAQEACHNYGYIRISRRL